MTRLDYAHWERTDTILTISNCFVNKCIDIIQYMQACGATFGKHQSKLTGHAETLKMLDRYDCSLDKNGLILVFDRCFR
jgi:hypothetical protein